MRAVLNISITEMVFREGHNATIRDNTCPAPGGGFVAERLGFVWSEKLQGVILGAFYWGYAATHVPGGVISVCFLILLYLLYFINSCLGQIRGKIRA